SSDVCSSDLAELVVVPHVQDHPVVIADGGLGVHHTGVAGTDEVGGNHFLTVGEIDLLVQVGVQRHVAQVLVDFLAIGGGLQVQVQDRHGHRSEEHTS